MSATWPPIVISNDTLRLMTEIHVVDAADAGLPADERAASWEAALALHPAYAQGLFLGLVDVLVQQLADATGVTPDKIVEGLREEITEPVVEEQR